MAQDSDWLENEAEAGPRAQPNSQPAWLAQSLRAGKLAFRSTQVVTVDGPMPATVVVEDGHITEIGAWEMVPMDAQLLDFGDLALLPGLVDTHVHINEADETQADGQVSRRDWEGFATATRAAAAGGVTTLVDMPLNCVPETISAAALEAKRTAADGHAYVDWMSWGGVVGNGNSGGNEAEMHGLAAAGVPGFKCFLVHSGVDGFAWVDEAQLRKSIAILREQRADLPLLAHAEVAGPIERSTKRLNEDGADWRIYGNYLASRPDESEVAAIELLIQLASDYGISLHIVHLASAKALPMIEQARAAGVKITVETCPHYLFFAAEEIPQGATEFKCAPPIRSATNREALWAALRDGIIDMVATDHSPCPPELKRRDTGRFDAAWGGVASLGLSLPIIWTGLRQRSAQFAEPPLALVARWLSAEPARLAGLTGKKGSLAVGYDADLLVFDINQEWTVSEANLHFRHKLSPYLGAHLSGRVLATYLCGRLIFDEQNGLSSMVDQAGGQELRRVV